MTREESITKAAELVERLTAGTPTKLASAKGSVLIARYLDAIRHPARGTGVVGAPGEEQVAYCTRFVAPVIADVAVRNLTRAHLQAVVNRAPTASVAAHLRRCLSAMVACGLEEACC